MSEQEKLQHELIKNTFKMIVMNDSRLTPYHKQQAVSELDKASRKADWFYDMIKQCGYIK